MTFLADILELKINPTPPTTSAMRTRAVGKLEGRQKERVYGSRKGIGVEPSFW